MHPSVLQCRSWDIPRRNVAVGVISGPDGFELGSLLYASQRRHFDLRFVPYADIAHLVRNERDRFGWRPLSYEGVPIRLLRQYGQNDGLSKMRKQVG